MGTKYQVFISSTFEDLEEEREQVIKAVLEMGHIPVGMEMFSAADDEQWQIITRQIDEVDYYAVIVAHRYGSVDGKGVSYTEKEYDYAVKKEVPVLGFVLDKEAPWPGDRIETDPIKKAALDSFKLKIKSRMVNFWNTKDDLHGKFSIALMKAFTTKPRIGWARADQTVGPDVMKEIARLSAENSALRAQLAKLDKAPEEEEERKYQDTVQVLANNSRDLYIWERTKTTWNEPTKTDLLKIFEAIAPNLHIENSVVGIADDVALHHTVEKYRDNGLCLAIM